MHEFLMTGTNHLQLAWEVRIAKRFWTYDDFRSRTRSPRFANLGRNLATDGTLTSSLIDCVLQKNGQHLVCPLISGPRSSISVLPAVKYTWAAKKQIKENLND
jgi:hypothetical protein